jgi:SAM-dependent methyltransferase
MEPVAVKDHTRRFSTRADNYARYRPSYPQQVLDVLREECGLTPDSVVADVGSGTGILTELFLRNGNTVYAVEPNREMREAAERLLSPYDSFHSIDGTAEATGLPDRSVQFVTAGQAFHWFDPDKARVEFTRILERGGWAVLVWNDRRTDSTPFLREYEELIRRNAPEYERVTHKQLGGDDMSRLFGPGGYRTASFPNHQVFDFEGLKGRLLSSSYAPEPGRPGHDAMMARLREIFDAHRQDGKVTFEYDTQMFFGRLTW